MTEKRARPHVVLTLAPELVASLDELAEQAGGLTRSRYVEQLVRAELERAKRHRRSNPT